MRVPCKNCLSRKLGCHDQCTEYLTYKAEREEEREKRNKEHEKYFKKPVSENQRVDKATQTMRRG